MEGLAFVLACVVALIYYKQLEVMRGQLREMEGGSWQSTQLLVVTAHQAGSTHELAIQAKNQAGAVGAQAKVMGKQLDLQQEVARVALGGAKLTVRFIALFHSDREKTIQAVIIVQNEGQKIPAKQIGCAGNLIVRSPTPDEVNFHKFGRYSPVQVPSPLAPFTEKDQNTADCLAFPGLKLTAERYASYKTKGGELYIWGALRHTEFGVVSFDTFCKHFPAQEVFKGPDGLRSYNDRRVGWGVFDPPNCGEH